MVQLPVLLRREKTGGAMAARLDSDALMQAGTALRAGERGVGGPL
ncbi:hypothetical protein [Herbaspirillum sp. WGmk3]|nr:hypothetical protein [Herbaspirillum sp. WGmk3]